MAKKSAAGFTVAAAQLSPVFMDREATIEKACEAIAEAGRKGAGVIVFPEVFVPGYPDWAWVIPPSRVDIHRAMYAELLAQSVTIPSPATDKLCRAAKSAGAYVVIGVDELNAEASGGSIYNTLLYIDDQGRILGRHRKLVPTAAERLVWAAGNGSTLEVYDTPYGKLGGLICWENYMPLARYAMYAWGVQIYVAATWDSSDAWVASLRHIAREGRCVVIGCCIAMKRDQIPDRFEFKGLYPPVRTPEQEWVNGGNSAIVAPDGRILAGPSLREETILYAEIDPAAASGERFWLDAAGHYARPDVFQLTVNRDPNAMINVTGNPPAINGHETPAPARKRRASA
ncbi:MAG: carbon-nitrogen hydrolase family protein [Chloroflexota bacterium]|nr:carbon-nitrogen hydrolase family protein [Chloroflexota bacterium]